MDITSYLLGKNAGGGGGNLQEKSVTVTANGSSTISPDEGYTGMSKVNLTTNVPVPGIPTHGVVFSEWDDNGFCHKADIYGMTSIPSYYFNGIASPGNYTSSQKLEQIIFHSAVSSLGSYCFAYLTNLRSIDLSSITNFGNNSSTYFIYCALLESVTLSNSLTGKIPESIFQGCKVLNISSLPSGITSIEGFAFAECAKLELSQLPSGITFIGNGAFNQCTKLNVSQIPDGVNTIRSLSFSKSGIKKMSMNNVTTIIGTGTGNGSFSSCPNLKQVWIGSAITNAGLPRYAFYQSSALEKIYIDLPRATVEAFTNYQYAFMDDTTKTGIIVCNDDPGFINKATFDAQVIN